MGRVEEAVSHSLALQEGIGAIDGPLDDSSGLVGVQAQSFELLRAGRDPVAVDLDECGRLVADLGRAVGSGLELRGTLLGLAEILDPLRTLIEIGVF